MQSVSVCVLHLQCRVHAAGIQWSRLTAEKSRVTSTRYYKASASMVW